MLETIKKAFRGSRSSEQVMDEPTTSFVPVMPAEQIVIKRGGEFIPRIDGDHIVAFINIYTRTFVDQMQVRFWIKDGVKLSPVSPLRNINGLRAWAAQGNVKGDGHCAVVLRPEDVTDQPLPPIDPRTPLRDPITKGWRSPGK